MTLPKLHSPHATSENVERQHSAVAYRRRPSPYFDGPMPSLAALGVSVFLALVLLVVGFTSSREQTGVLPNAYSEAGKFSAAFHGWVTGAMGSLPVSRKIEC